MSSVPRQCSSFLYGVRDLSGTFPTLANKMVDGPNEKLGHFQLCDVNFDLGIVRPK